MSFSMELRSRRSKSRTPVRSTVFEEQLQNLENHMSVKTVTKTYSTKNSYSNIYPSEIIDNDINNIKHSTNGWKSIERSQYKGSSQNDDEITSTSSIYQNTSNQTLDDSEHSFISTGSNVSALEVYRAAGEYWNKYPKTDYTYSIHSKDRKEIAPGVVAMPNMSRRSLHNYGTEVRDHHTYNNKHNSTQSFLQDEVDYSTKTDSWLTTASRLQPRALFSNNSSHDNLYKHTTASASATSLFTRMRSVSKNVLVTILTFFYVIYTIQNSVFIWIGKQIYKATTQMMLWDTWLLQTGMTRKKKLNSVLALCLVPLLLFGGWWLFNELGSVLFATEYISTKMVSNTPVKIQDYESFTQINVEQRANMLTSEQLQAIAKLLENSDIQHIINHNKHIKFVDTLNRQDEAYSKHYLDDLKGDIMKFRLDLQNLENMKNSELVTLAAQLRQENAKKIAQLTYQLNRCCRSSYIEMENHVLRILRDLLGAPNYIATPQDISRWLHSTFVAKHDLEIQLNNLTEHLQSDYNMLVKDNRKLIMETVMAKVLSELNSRIDKIEKHDVLGELSVESLTDEYIKKIVQNSLEVYDADKTGLVDYALESAGGQILSTRCTESYHARTAVFSLFGIPLWYLGNTPRTVIMPGVTPGECWAFQNFPGFVVIKLTAPVKIEAFSLEHISKLLAPNGKIDSAPKEFFVFGLRNDTDKEPVLLGQYKYDLSGPPLQYFAAQVHGLIFNIVELRIHSNHGNPNYTCLYRFRVHGILSNEPT